MRDKMWLGNTSFWLVLARQPLKGVVPSGAFSNNLLTLG